ncbi:hypothetical protein AJ79_04861 [Helicocarpus griseus UAMH5409]|uniref:Uncharacterized protein n=1 Tax=Helicocarpus griseus UAMH5409 TaxID=1447875 RepID=A0A2B7XQL0_9EURO|nr:hypothetical protein AJ79_04861 [Helicocarpus griseus UAMH5409]
MLAARDQENLVHVHQTTAAGKPLNQGTRQLQPKTPGLRAPKTPFRVPLNDENNSLAFGGKRTVKANNAQNENLLRSGKDSIAGGNALVTPMGPRNRAPLGMKTTNAKAKGLQTPAPPLDTSKPNKTTNRPSTTRKVKQNAPEVKQSQPKAVAADEVEDDVPDIEYMPPKPQALPDPPEDIPYNTDFPQFKGKNFTRGWHKLYPDNEVGEDGLTRREREMKTLQEAYDKEMEEKVQKEIDNMELLDINVRQFPDEPCAEEIAADIRKKREQKQQPAKKVIVDRSVSTVKSRNAARMLSQQPRPSIPPKPKPRVSSAPKIRFSSGLLRPKKQPAPSNPSPMRHAAATASSRTTLGYSKGRRVSSNLRQKAPDTKQTKSDILSPEKYVELYGTPPFGSEMWSRCKAAGMFDSDGGIDAAADDFEEEIPPFPEEDEESANFQLTL